MNTTDRFNPANMDTETRPYPLWWDYLNGAVVALVILLAAAMVLMWMVGASLTLLR